MGECVPKNDSEEEWLNAAIRSNERSRLAAILVPGTPGLGKLSACSEVTNFRDILAGHERVASTRLTRQEGSYVELLAPFVLHAKKLMLVDPYLGNHTEAREWLTRLLAMAGARKTKPLIELHIKARDRLERLERVFRDWLESDAARLDLTIQVFVWKDFHDRYLLTDLSSISLPYGFNVETKSTSYTTWAMLGRLDSENVMREFDKAADKGLRAGRHVADFYLHKQRTA
jgi:hypothetical protein